MSVRAVTPYVTRHGHVIHTWDEFTDAVACGEFDPEGLPEYRLPGRSSHKLSRPNPPATRPHGSVAGARTTPLPANSSPPGVGGGAVPTNVESRAEGHRRGS
jgi:hypothetical protein